MNRKALLILFLTLLIASPGMTMDWLQGSYDMDGWRPGYAPLGFDDDEIRTSIDAGRPSYYFRKLFFLPSTYDPTISELRLTVHSPDGVIVSFNGVEIDRSHWLPAGDLPYDTLGSTTEPSGIQQFDLTHELYRCENSIGNNWRPVTVELHRTNPNDPLVFDAEIEALIYSNWQTVDATGSRWTWLELPGLPPSLPEPTLGVIRYPLPGMPVVVSPGQDLKIILDDSESIQNSTFVLEGNHESILLDSVRNGTPDPLGNVFLCRIPFEILPDTYSLNIFTPLNNPQPQSPVQDHWESPNSVAVLPVPDRSISIAHISDSHVPYRGSWNPDNTELLQNVWDRLPELQPDLLIHTGDGYNEGNYRDQAELFRRMLGDCPVPVVYVGGNHELGEWCGDGTARQHYWDFFGWPRLDPRRSDALPMITRDFIVDAGAVSLVCVEAWESYSSFWSTWYPYLSLTAEQETWIADNAAVRPLQTLVACYHHDFDGRLESSVLPDAGFSMGLSGHTHSDDHYQVGAVNYYKVGSTYQASQPLRWFHFNDGVPEGGDLIIPGAVTVTYDPPLETPAMERTITVRNNEFSPLPGHKVEVTMLPGLDYGVTGNNSAEIVAQHQSNNSCHLWILNNLEPRQTIEFSVYPRDIEPPCCSISFDYDSNLFIAGEPNHIQAILLNLCQSNLVQPYIALEAGGVFYFWPDWSTEPTIERLYLNQDQVIRRSVMDLTWPENLAMFGESVTLWGVIIDDDTGDIVSSLTQTEILY